MQNAKIKVAVNISIIAFSPILFVHAVIILQQADKVKKYFCEVQRKIFLDFYLFFQYNT